MLSLATASLFAFAVPATAQPAKPVYGDWGYDASAMDKAVKPGDDFWEYVNGAWDKNTPIAADRASAGPFVTLSDESEKDVATSTSSSLTIRTTTISVSRSAIIIRASWTRLRSRLPAPLR